MELDTGEIILSCAAVRTEADMTRREARSRKWSGPQWAEHRKFLRDHAAELDKLALKLQIMAVGQIPAKR